MFFLLELHLQIKKFVVCYLINADVVQDARDSTFLGKCTYDLDH